MRTPSVRKERCELRQVSMLPAIFLLCDITIVFSQLNNCLPKRFLCEKRSRQTLSYGRLSPRETLLSLSLANSQCPHLPSSGTGWAGERVIVEQYHGYLVSCGALYAELRRKQQSATNADCTLDQLIRSAYPDEIHLRFTLKLAPKRTPNLSV